MTNAPFISVVDDDLSVRESLEGLFKSLEFPVELFPSAESFLRSETLEETDCVIVDVCMPGMSGPDLQRVLLTRPTRIPIIFISAHADEEVISRVMTDGAVACLGKPFSEDSLLNAIALAVPGGQG